MSYIINCAKNPKQKEDPNTHQQAGKSVVRLSTESSGHEDQASATTGKDRGWSVSQYYTDKWTKQAYVRQQQQAKTSRESNNSHANRSFDRLDVSPLRNYNDLKD